MKTNNIFLNKKNIIIGISTLLISGMIIYNSKDAIFGAPLTIYTTQNGTTLKESFLPISGNAKHAQELLINGREIAFNRSGEFNDGVVLSPGYNIIEVSLSDKFGNKKTKTYHVVLEKTPTVATTQQGIINNLYKKYGN